MADDWMEDLVQRFRRGEISSKDFQEILHIRMGAGPQDMVVFRGVPSEGLNLGSWSGADEARFQELLTLPEQTPQTRAEGQQLWERKRTAGGQFFSDTPEVALQYAKDTGSVHAMKLSPEEVLEWSKGTQTTPGGISSNFHVPNEAIQTAQAEGRAVSGKTTRGAAMADEPKKSRFSSLKEELSDYDRRARRHIENFREIELEPVKKRWIDLQMSGPKGTRNPKFNLRDSEWVELVSRPGELSPEMREALELRAEYKKQVRIDQAMSADNRHGSTEIHERWADAPEAPSPAPEAPKAGGGAPAAEAPKTPTKTPTKAPEFKGATADALVEEMPRSPGPLTLQEQARLEKLRGIPYSELTGEAAEEGGALFREELRGRAATPQSPTPESVKPPAPEPVKSPTPEPVKPASLPERQAQKLQQAARQKFSFGEDGYHNLEGVEFDLGERPGTQRAPSSDPGPPLLTEDALSRDLQQDPRIQGDARARQQLSRRGELAEPTFSPDAPDRTISKTPAPIDQRGQVNWKTPEGSVTPKPLPGKAPVDTRRPAVEAKAKPAPTYNPPPEASAKKAVEAAPTEAPARNPQQQHPPRSVQEPPTQKKRPFEGVLKGEGGPPGPAYKDSPSMGMPAPRVPKKALKGAGAIALKALKTGGKFAGVAGAAYEAALLGKDIAEEGLIAGPAKWGGRVIEDIGSITGVAGMLGQGEGPEERMGMPASGTTQAMNLAGRGLEAAGGGISSVGRGIARGGKALSRKLGITGGPAEEDTSVGVNPSEEGDGEEGAEFAPTPLRKSRDDAAKEAFRMSQAPRPATAL